MITAITKHFRSALLRGPVLLTAMLLLVFTIDWEARPNAHGADLLTGIFSSTSVASDEQPRNSIDFATQIYSSDSIYFDFYWGQGWAWDRGADGALTHNSRSKNTDLSKGTNCGPTTVAMALRYATNNSLAARSLTPEQILRTGMQKAAKSLTSSQDIERALAYYDVGYRTVPSSNSAADAIAEIDRELTSPITPTLWTSIVILPVVPTAIRNSAAIVQMPDNADCNWESCVIHDGRKYRYTSAKDSFTGKYYQYRGIHWILLIGSYEIGGEPYFLVHDPLTFENLNKYYYFGDFAEPKGQNAFYRYDDVTEAYGRAKSQVAYPIIVTNTPANPASLDSVDTIADGIQPQADDAIYERITSVMELNYPAGSYVSPGQMLKKTWLLSNAGQSDVMFEYTLRQVSGPQIESYGGSYLPPIQRGETREASILVRAPLASGVYDTKWAVYNAHEQIVSDPISFRFIVHSSAPIIKTPTPSPDWCDISPTTPGVILYQNKNYQGRCSFATGDRPDLGDLEVGDNRVSSIRINGSYKVKLYEDVDYGGRREEVNSSDPDLDIRSLGEQYSSLKVSFTASCLDSQAPGVFLYENRDYGGSCYHLVADAKDLGNTTVGDNDVSSVRVNGDYAVELYKNRNFDGPSDEIMKNEANLDTRSLGNQYSSARLKVIARCSDTSMLGVYLYDQANFKGNCTYLAGDEPDLGVTAVGDNGTRSIRIVGDIHALLYTEKAFTGSFNKITADAGDLRLTPVGDNVSSIQIRYNNRPPEPPILNTSVIGGSYPFVGNYGNALYACWEEIPDADGDALRFRARAVSPQQEIYSAWMDDNCWTVQDAPPETYALSVQASDSEYTSQWSAPITFRIGEWELLNAPQIIYYDSIVAFQRIFVIGRNAAEQLQLDVYDVKDKVNLQFMNSVDLGYALTVPRPDAVKLVVMGNYLLLYYPSSLDILQVIDITNPVKPVIAAQLGMPFGSGSASVEVYGNRLLIVTGRGELHVVDLSTPTRPQVLSSAKLIELATGADFYEAHISVFRDVFVSIVSGSNLVLVDLTDLTQPRVVARLDLREATGVSTFAQSSIHIYKNWLYIANGNGGVLHIFDISVPTNPLPIGSYDQCYVNSLGGFGGVIIGGEDQYLYYRVAGHICLLEITTSGELQEKGIGKFGTPFMLDPSFEEENRWLVSLERLNDIFVGKFSKYSEYPQLTGLLFSRYHGEAPFPFSAPPVGEVATPGQSASFTTDVGIVLTVTIPSDAVTEQTFFVAQSAPEQPVPKSYSVLGEPFSLNAYLADAGNASNFAAPIALTLNYSKFSNNESSGGEPKLYVWRASPDSEQSRWELVQSSTDQQSHAVSAEVDHLTTFILVEHNSTYLPLISR